MLAKKLHIKPGHKVAVLHGPKGFEIDGVEAANVLVGKPDVILYFAVWHSELAHDWKKITGALPEGGVLWVAYPKKSSGMESDLAGMMSWDVYKDSDWQPVASIAIDATWSAARFKYSPGLADERQERVEEQIKDADGMVIVDKKTREIFAPKDLAKLLDKNVTARRFFDSLSFTNRKEYVMWVIEAKRPETRSLRLGKTIEKLLAGKKNPADK